MKLKELLSSPDKWIQGHYALDAEGDVIDAQDPDAVCFCLQGAIRRCYNDGKEPYRFTDEYKGVKSRILHEIGEPITTWNDAPERTFEDIKQLVEKLDI
jgi:hypothetical protein